jgi:hypothetical protein
MRTRLAENGPVPWLEILKAMVSPARTEMRSA